MAPRIGIDLGTTFSCAAWIGDDGRPIVVPTADGQLTTPSVICFDGRQAWVGDKANQRKEIARGQIREFVKRNMGKPAMPDPSRPGQEVEPYRFGDTCYGAAGMSALILRKLKRDAVRFLKSRGVLPSEAEELNTAIEAVITVPAYFGDAEREATRLAGVVAGLDVIGIINEPTAAAISYGELRKQSACALVFDLGGGTLDVTILQISGNGDRVLSKAGANQTGGRDWDILIQEYLYETFRKKYGRDVPDEFGFEVQRVAIEGKHALTKSPSTSVSVLCDGDEITVELHEQSPNSGRYGAEDQAFYFERRSTALLHVCQMICEKALSEGLIESPSGPRSMTWADVDDIVLAGGACRMPMIPRLLERISGKKIARHVADFDYDTAIAIGAAYYSHDKGRINDTMSQSIGLLIREGDRTYIEPILKRNEQLPASVSKTMPADAGAEVAVYELPDTVGRVRPDEARLRGRVDLLNASFVGEVLLTFAVDGEGHLKIRATFPPDGQRELELRDTLRWSSESTELLRKKVLDVKLHS